MTSHAIRWTTTSIALIALLSTSAMAEPNAAPGEQTAPAAEQRFDPKEAQPTAAEGVEAARTLWRFRPLKAALVTGLTPFIAAPMFTDAVADGSVGRALLSFAALTTAPIYGFLQMRAWGRETRESLSVRLNRRQERGGVGGWTAGKLLWAGGKIEGGYNGARTWLAQKSQQRRARRAEWFKARRIAIQGALKNRMTRRPTQQQAKP